MKRREEKMHPSSRRARGRREGFEAGTERRGGCGARFHLHPSRGGARRPGMDKLVQFGRKAWFVVRVLSGYEERRIRAHRLQMQQRIARETAIDEYFKPIDKNAKIIMDMQLEKEEKQIKEMTKVMQDQIAMQREIASKRAQATAIESKDAQTQTSDKIAEGPPKEETMK
uniref:Uncharacterized protein n=2 Tax=Oryza rufipogon TaxID=4529 RepID=A0A0E0P9B5_ORYRU